MVEIRLPISLVYETTGVTPVSDIIEALRATDDLARDAAALLPSFISGLQIDKSSLNVRILSQESPLREAFFLALLITYQDDLRSEVPPMIEDLFKVTVSDKYDTIVTLVFLTIVFYGTGLAIDAVKKMVTSSLPRERFEELSELLARQTGKTSDEVLKIIQAHFEKPSAAKRLLIQAKRIFLPSQRDRNAPMLVDRDRIDSNTIREIPYVGEAEKPSDFDRYKPYYGVMLDLHAMDRDKAATGWAAVADGISDRRLKVRVMDPVQPSDLWGQPQVKADIVLVSKLTADGYVPAEIQVTGLVKPAEPPALPPPSGTAARKPPRSRRG